MQSWAFTDKSLDVKVHSDLTYLRAYVATHMQGQRAQALFTSSVMSFYNKNPLTFIGDQKNGTETPLLYAKHLVWALHHFEGTCSSTYSSINDHYTPFQMFPLFNVACTWQLSSPAWLGCSPTTFFFFSFSFQTSVKTCEGLSILALSVNSSVTHVSIRLVHALA